MSKKFVVWALALMLGLGGLSYSASAAEEAKKEDLAKIKKSDRNAEAAPQQQEAIELSKHKKKKKKAEIPTEPAPDAKAPEGK